MEIVEPLTDRPATEQGIRALERELGEQLPESYYRFLKVHNGGRPEPARFEFETCCGRSGSIINWFYTMEPIQVYNIGKKLDVFYDRIPQGLLPIACDPLGNQVLLGVSERRGEIFFWDHELETEADHEWGNVSLVAKSFDDFLTMLR